MILIKDFDAATYIKMYQYWESSIITCEIRFPFKYIKRRFILNIQSHSHNSFNWCTQLDTLKLSVTCLKFQLWKNVQISVTRFGMTDYLHICGANFYLNYVSSLFPNSPEHQSLFPSVWEFLTSNFRKHKVFNFLIIGLLYALDFKCSQNHFTSEKYETAQSF